MLENRTNLFARRRLTRAQDHRHRFATRGFIDMDRQKAALVIMSVEKRKLLMTVHRVAGVINVECDRGRCAPVALTERIHKRHHRSGHLDLRRHILQSGHGGLRAQRIAALRCMANRHLEDWINPQRIAIVSVLVTRRDRKCP